MATTTPIVAPANTFAFRVIVRGTTPSGVRVRRVRNVQASMEDGGAAAVLAADDIASEISKADKLTGLFVTVYPPVGILCAGKGLSKGWSVAADGSIVRGVAA